MGASKDASHLRRRRWRAEGRLAPQEEEVGAPQDEVKLGKSLLVLRWPRNAALEGEEASAKFPMRGGDMALALGRQAASLAIGPGTRQA